jgi:hypothetical protein
MKNENNNLDTRAIDSSKRKFIKRSAYLAPLVLTMKAVPSFAAAGSGYNGPNGGQGPSPERPS